MHHLQEPEGEGLQWRVDAEGNVGGEEGNGTAPATVTMVETTLATKATMMITIMERIARMYSNHEGLSAVITILSC